jgi:sulfite exporter TauE/SafE
VSLGPWLTVATASLLGSAHCAAMCGGFVSAYAGGESQKTTHLAYNAGRLTSYLALGALAGALGGALDLAGRAAGLAHGAALVTGGLLLFWGVLGLSSRPALIRLQRGKTSSFASRFSALLVSFRNRPAHVRAGLLGLSSTLLPCGWLYAFAAFAAATGSALGGAWLMSAFWAGSLPMMLGVGLSLQSLTARLGRRLPRLRAGLALAAGVLTLVWHFQGAAFAASSSACAPAGASAPKASDCPCHKHSASLALSRAGAP